MIKLISMKFASNASLFTFGILWLFHFVVIVGGGLFSFIPMEIVWGGGIDTKGKLIILEILAIIIITICLLLTLVKTKYVNVPRLYNISHYAMWVFFVYFLLNTLGNLLSESLFEKSMAILTILLSLCTLRLALEENSNSEENSTLEENATTEEKEEK